MQQQQMMMMKKKKNTSHNDNDHRCSCKWIHKLKKDDDSFPQMVIDDRWFRRDSAFRQKQFHNNLRHWVDRHKLRPDLDADTAGQLARHINYVPLDKFDASLDKLLIKLKESIKKEHKQSPKQWTEKFEFNNKKNNWNKYQVLMPYEQDARPKSTTWLAPKLLCSMPKKSYGGYININAIQDKIENNVILYNQGHRAWCRDVIYIDDASYSGQQVTDILECLVKYMVEHREMLKNQISNEQQNGGKKGLITTSILERRHHHQENIKQTRTTQSPYDYNPLLDFLTYVRVWVVIPYMTLHAHKKLKDLQTRLSQTGTDWLRLRIVTRSGHMRSASSVFTKLRIKGNTEETALTIFEHKIPDYLSFPERLRLGNLLYKIKDSKYSSTLIPYLSTDNGKKNNNTNTPPQQPFPFVSLDDIKPYSISEPTVQSQVPVLVRLHQSYRKRQAALQNNFVKKTSTTTASSSRKMVQSETNVIDLTLDE